MFSEFQPREYQQRIITSIVERNRHAVLIEPGLGKTAIMLEAFRRLRGKKKVLRMLVIAPLTPLYFTWIDEVRKWEQFRDFRVGIVHGPKKKDVMIRRDVDIFLINPEGIQFYYEQIVRGTIPPHMNMLVIDESTKFKNSRASRTRYLTQLIELFERRYILTGYPAPNGYIDLWSQMYLLDKGKALGKTLTAFQREYFYQEQQFNKFIKLKLKNDAIERINTAISPLISQLSVEDVMQLPKLHHVPIKIKPSKKFEREYHRLETQLVVEIDNMKTAFQLSAATSLMKCRQFANGFVYAEDEVITVNNEKIKALNDFIETLQGKPVLIFYTFKEDGKRIMESLKVPVSAQIHGGMSQKKKVEIFERWNRGTIDALVCQPNTMAHGANIQKGGSIIIWYSLVFDYELYYQGFRRLYRSGQNHPTYNYYLMMHDTVDEDIYAAIRGKKHQIYQSFVDYFKDRTLPDAPNLVNF